jgi:hypothetical protein
MLPRDRSGKNEEKWKTIIVNIKDRADMDIVEADGERKFILIKNKSI